MPNGAFLPHWECLTVFLRVCTQKQPRSNLTSLKLFGTKMLDNWRRSSRMISPRPDVSNPSRSLVALFPFIAVVPSGSAQCDGDGDKNNQKIPLCNLFVSSCATRSTCSRPELLNLEKPRPPTGQPAVAAGHYLTDAGRVRRLGL